MMAIRSFKIRVYPTKAQEERLNNVLCKCCVLYNAALQERRDAWKVQQRWADPVQRKKYAITLYSQQSQLKEIDGYEGLKRVAEYALRKVDRSFKAFFRRCKTGEKPGYPRFKPARYYDSFCTDQCISWTDRTIKIIGMRLKWKPWCVLPPKYKFRICRIKREADGWYAVLACDVDPQPQPITHKQVGVDLGMISLIAPDR